MSPRNHGSTISTQAPQIQDPSSLHMDCGETFFDLAWISLGDSALQTVSCPGL